MNSKSGQRQKIIDAGPSHTPSSFSMNRTGPVKIDSQRPIAGSAFSKNIPTNFSSLNDDKTETKVKNKLNVVSP